MGGNAPLNPGLPLERTSAELEEEVDPAVWNRVFSYARSLVSSRAEAEDLTQDVFVVLFKERRAGRPVEQVGAWMRTVARHLAYRRFHRQRPDLHISLDATAGDNQRSPFELEDTAPSPERQVIDKRLLQLSARIIYEFAERDRECILMYFRGYDFLQIATVLGVSRWTARRLTLKALRRFQARMHSSQTE
ncbi:RNA polymerase sigma factor [Terriglobus tenax]|uniref:RNA polymerase sigma factor n=1 Tax=Terriglobus tenax TaxID=1111115 RepID=UPI0021E0545F|nr:sigma-70 family RNA polymerase sigma factor [Terriglobus tenax]